MASSNAERRVTLRALYDSTEMRRGADDSERALKDLERTTDQTSESMNRSLRTVDDGVSSSFGRGGSLDRSLDDADSNLTEFADTAREEVPNALLDMQDGASSAIQGLSQAFASIGPGGTIIATVLAGMTVLINKSEQTAQAMRDRINTALSQIEVKARSTDQALLRGYEKTRDWTKVVEEFGGGDATKGFDKVSKLADSIGFEVSDIVNLINQKWTPGAQRLQAYMDHQLTTTQEIAGRGEVNLAVLNGQLNTFLAIQNAQRNQAEEQERTYRALVSQRDTMAEVKRYQDQLAREANGTADAYERAARAAERADAAVHRWAGRRLPDPTTG